MVRARRRKSKTDPTSSLAQLDHVLAKIQLGILLGAALIVPLVVLPESNFVDITSTPKTTTLRMLGSLQGGVLLSRFLLTFTATEHNRLIESIQTIRSHRSAMMILGSVAAVTAVSLISTVLSILPGQSWWDRVPAGFKAGEYTALMYIVLSISTVISVREFSTSGWIWKALTTTAILAGLVGFFQFLGWSPFDISTTHSIRLTGTNGNPIFYGAMLAVLAPIALGYLLNGYQRSSEVNNRFWLVALALASFVLAVGFIGTVSRGPWAGGIRRRRGCDCSPHHLRTFSTAHHANSRGPSVLASRGSARHICRSNPARNNLERHSEFLAQ